MVRSTQKEIRQRAPLWLLVLLALNLGLMTWDAKDAATKQRDPLRHVMFIIFNCSCGLL